MARIVHQYLSFVPDIVVANGGTKGGFFGVASIEDARYNHATLYPSVFFVDVVFNVYIPRVASVAATAITRRVMVAAY